MGDGGTGEKTEEPTPQRLRQLREQGNVCKSQDITQAAILMVSFVALTGTITTIYQKIIDFTHSSFHAAMYFNTEDTHAIIPRIMDQAFEAMMLTEKLNG